MKLNDTNHASLTRQFLFPLPFSKNEILPILGTFLTPIGLEKHLADYFLSPPQLLQRYEHCWCLVLPWRTWGPLTSCRFTKSSGCLACCTLRVWVLVSPLPKSHFTSQWYHRCFFLHPPLIFSLLSSPFFSPLSSMLPTAWLASLPLPSWWMLDTCFGSPSHPIFVWFVCTCGLSRITTELPYGRSWL